MSDANTKSKAPHLTVVGGSEIPPVATAPVFVDERDLEELTPISRATWQYYRAKGGGPPYRKVGRRCVYAWADVVAWFEAQPART